MSQSNADTYFGCATNYFTQLLSDSILHCFGLLADLDLTSLYLASSKWPTRPQCMPLYDKLMMRELGYVSYVNYLTAEITTMLLYAWSLGLYQ